MGKLIPNSFNLLVVIYVALGSTACSYGMAIIGYVVFFSVWSTVDFSTVLPLDSRLFTNLLTSRLRALPAMTRLPSI